MWRSRILLVLVALSLIASACGGGTELSSEPEAETPSSSATTGVPVESARSYETARATDLTWATPTLEPELVGTEVQATSGEKWPMALVYPEADAPPSGWPVIVYFHGSALGTPLDGLDRLAANGAVVVGPRWTLPEWSVATLRVLSAEEYVDGYWFDVASCAFAAAQEAAASYGGDPARTTVVGFSAGVHPAIRTALGEPRNDLCPDREPSLRPTGLVAGDSQWLFQGADWDATFDDPNSLASDTVDRILNPQRWATVPDGFRVYLWSTDSTAWEREVDSPPGADSWLATRMPEDATLIEDLDAVGAFDDGRIMFGDNALLLEKRLEASGLRVLHETFPTDHSYAPGVYDAISELVFD